MPQTSPPVAVRFCALKIEQIAVGHFVAVRIRPCPRCGGRQQRNRVRATGQPAGGSEALQVLVQAHLQCRLAVAEQVVRELRLRRHVLVVQILRCREGEVACGREVRRPQCLLRERAREVVEPYAQGDGRAMDRPFVLCIDSKVLVHMVLLRVRKRPHRQLVRHAVVEPVGQRILDVGQVVVITVGVVHADLEGMRAGDIRHVEAVVEVVVPRVVVRPDPAAVVEAGDRSALLVDPDHHRVEDEPLGLEVHVAPALHAMNAAGLDQHTVREGRRPVEQHHALCREPTILRRFRRGRRADGVMARAEVLLCVRQADLVFWRQLERETALRVQPRLLD